MRPLVYSDTITIRTDAELRAAIEDAAERENADLSSWVRRALASVVKPDGSTSSTFPASVPHGASASHAA